VIKLLLKENPVLPTSFKFKGECLILKIKREEGILTAKQSSPFVSTKRELFQEEEL